MNYLAHLYLSGDADDFLKLGNFMGDTIVGKQYENYPESIQKGILLHRSIDAFTDAHSVFRQSKKRLVPDFNHYSGVIVDIFYDYFLAKNWRQFHRIPLEKYADDFYKLLKINHLHLNEKAIYLANYMEKENWLVAYQTISGISEILYKMDKRTDFRSKMRLASFHLEKYESEFETEFFMFFNDIIKFVLKP